MRKGEKMTKSISKTRALAESALLIALGTILAQIKIIDMPYGGSVTLFSMVPFMLISFRHGVRYGLIAGFANALLQMLLGFSAPPAGTVAALIGVILLDYVLAFLMFAFAACVADKFKNKIVGVGVGAAVTCFGRFLCSFASGILLWSSYQEYYEWALDLPVWLYSLIYNANYMLPELVLSTIAVVILYKAMPKIFS